MPELNTPEYWRERARIEDEYAHLAERREQWKDFGHHYEVANSFRSIAARLEADEAKEPQP